MEHNHCQGLKSLVQVFELCWVIFVVHRFQSTALGLLYSQLENFDLKIQNGKKKLRLGSYLFIDFSHSFLSRILREYLLAQNFGMVDGLLIVGIARLEEEATNKRRSL